MEFLNYTKSFVLILFITLLVPGCQQKASPGSPDQISQQETDDDRFIDQFLNSVDVRYDYELDLEGIKERDTLKAITTYSPTSYFLYRGRPMGYEYELAVRLAEYLDVELEMVVARNIDAIFQLLNQGAGDVVMHNLTVTKDRKEYVDFTLPLNFTHQVLVQKKPDNWRKMKLHEIDQELIRNPIHLIGKTIHVRANSSYRERLLNLEEELGGDIDIQYLSGELSTSEIIEKVNSGEIEYTIADFNIAKINRSYFQDIDIETTVGVMTRLAWAVRKSSPELLSEINSWLKEERQSSDYYVIYNKYFKNSRDYKRRVKSDLYAPNSGKISEYDELIRDTGEDFGWDWRLLAAQIYQESQFDPKEKSWAGAIGLMQLMPKTAKSYGFTRLTVPETNLKAGIAHLEYLNEYWKEHISDSTERVKFILASYNAGQNHVQDARRLARKKGWDDDVWYDNVEKAMLLKSKKKYFTMPEVKYGFCRGEEPVNYVQEILQRYKYYKEFVEEEQSIRT
jgi:membrane-bound lytic murein transglycosylase F